ncbi:hypothetical protein [Cupriavidus sp. YAF13]|uniref:hypothetical protein n=1 Tax=Cupriavidus sp. YAF13 TaxID=3233075 RepID=UPI003F923A88
MSSAFQESEIQAQVVDSKLQEWLKRYVWGEFQSENPNEAFKTGPQEMQQALE